MSSNLSALVSSLEPLAKLDEKDDIACRCLALEHQCSVLESAVVFSNLRARLNKLKLLQPGSVLEARTQLAAAAFDVCGDVDQAPADRENNAVVLVEKMADVMQRHVHKTAKLREAFLRIKTELFIRAALAYYVGETGHETDGKRFKEALTRLLPRRNDRNGQHHDNIDDLVDADVRERIESTYRLFDNFGKSNTVVEVRYREFMSEMNESMIKTAVKTLVQCLQTAVFGPPKLIVQVQAEQAATAEVLKLAASKLGMTTNQWSRVETVRPVRPPVRPPVQPTTSPTRLMMNVKPKGGNEDGDDTLPTPAKKLMGSMTAFNVGMTDPLGEIDVVMASTTGTGNVKKVTFGASPAKKMKIMEGVGNKIEPIAKMANVIVAGISHHDAADTTAVAATATAIRTKVKWSEEEVNALKRGVEEFGVGEWAKVLQAYKNVFNSVRTGVHLKDKWRALQGRVPPGGGGGSVRKSGGGGMEG